MESRECNADGINLIVKYEGCSLTAYRDSSGILTIGYGHTGGITEGLTITEEKAEELLIEDLKISEDYVNYYVNRNGLELNDNQFSALVSFCFNCGCGNLQKLITGKTVEQIADDILLYNKSNGVVLQGLINRRKDEQELFLSRVPVYYPQFVDLNFKQALDYLGIDNSFKNRTNIAVINKIVNKAEDYNGTYEQNVTMFTLLKNGKLINYYDE